MGQAFISYSRRDKEKVYAICKILEDAGYAHWLDKEDIPTSEQWRAKIVEGIKSSDSFVLFISPSAISSPNVIAELNIASEQEHKGKLKIIPVMLVSIELTDAVEYQLSGIQRIDLSQDFATGLQNLLTTLGNITLPKGYKKHLLGHLPGTYVTPEIIAPLPNPSREVVVGKTITTKHIQDQRFMRRSHALANLASQLDLIVKDQEKSRDNEIFTLWIHGRSGSGKSVLLLQLMQELVLQKQAQAFWYYSDQTDKLYEFFEKWPTYGIDLKEPIFLFVDDFNTPLTRDLLENKSISSLLRTTTNPNINWPIVITCSPPEYLHDFRSGGKDEGFRITEWEIPTLDAEESNQLIQWFASRTGRKPKTGKAFEQSEGLALSMLFELWYYSQYTDGVDKNQDVMKAFGHRFKIRLENLGLTDAIAPLLALNRLYIWPPNVWLEELTFQQRDAFNILVEDKDFSILSLKPSDSGYIRLTHPHLSDAIYQTIRPKSITKLIRASDLAYCFEKALQTDIVLANQLLRSVSEKICEENERLATDEIDIDELSKSFAKIWIHLRSVIEGNRGLLPYWWINWAVWSSKHPNTLEYLNEENIIAKALNYLGVQHRLWGELWQKLWSSRPGDTHLVESALNWLIKNQDSQGWSFVWRILLEHPDDLPDGTTVGSLLASGVRWLDGREDKDQWTFVWQILLQHQDDLPKRVSLKSLIASGTQWLQGHEDKNQWSFVWEILLQHPDDLPEGVSLKSLIASGTHWLQGREDKNQWNYVWQILLQHPDDLPEGVSLKSLIASGTKWLQGHEDKAQWSFVWQTLSRNRTLLDADDEFLSLGLKWLQKSEDREDWNYIWKDLLASSDLFKRELVTLGSQWLGGREDKDQWAFVWQILLEYPDDLPDGTTVSSLLASGVRWLDGREDKDQWTFVWRILLEHPDDLPDGTTVGSLLASGVRWLDGREDKDQWTFVWRILLEHPDDLSEVATVNSLIKKGAQRLVEREDTDQWAFIWHTLLNASSSLGQLDSLTSILESGFQWLKRHEDRNEWSYTWESLLQHSDYVSEKISVVEILDLGISWLAGRENKDDWNYVWQTLVQRIGSTQGHISSTELFDIGAQWLSQQKESNMAWGKVFEICIRNGLENYSILRKGISWLQENTEKSEASGIALAISKRVDMLQHADQESLENWLVSWLSKNPDHKSWTYAWEAYWNIYPSSREATHLALSTIKVKKTSHGIGWVILTLIESEDYVIWGLIYEWLTQNMENVSWDYVWETSWKKMQSPAMADLCIQWATLYSNNKNVTKKLLILALRDSTSVAILQIKNWLIKNIDHSSWPSVWAAYWEFAPGTETIDILLDWLSQQMGQEKNIYGWAIATLKKSADDNVSLSKEIDAKVFMWLHENLSNPYWIYAWVSYWSYENNLKSVDIGLRWLEKYANKPADVKWLIKRIKTSRNSEIEKVIHEWLKQNPSNPWTKLLIAHLLKV